MKRGIRALTVAIGGSLTLLAGCAGPSVGLTAGGEAMARRSPALPSNWIERQSGTFGGDAIGSPLAWEYGRNDPYQPFSPAFAPSGAGVVYQRDSQRIIHGDPFDTFIHRSWSVSRD